MQVKNQQLELDMEQHTGSKLGKEYVKAIYCHPADLTYMQNTSCKMLGWKEHKLESRLLGEISITSDTQMTPPLWQKVKKNQRASWWKWKREWKIWLNIQHSENKDQGIWSHHFMANRWGNNGNSDRLYYLGLQNHTGGDYSYEIKRCLLLGRKAMTNLDSIIKKQRHSFANKGPSSQSYGFSSNHVWMWELDYKTKCRRIDAFELWCWRRLLRVPWTMRRSNQSILKEISPEYSLEGLMLKLKLQYYGHLIWRTDSLAKTMMLGKIESRRKRW